MNVDLAHVPLPRSARDDRYKGAAVHYPPARHGDHKIRLPPIPDLRFEQSFLASLSKFIHPIETAERELGKEATQSDNERQAERGALVSSVDFNYGVPLRIEWASVIWIAVRDQVMMPFLTGTLWNTADLIFRPLLKGASASLFGGRKRPTSPSSNEIGWWRKWVRSVSGATETNIALRG